MSGAFLADLELPETHHHLEVGSGSQAEQTGGIMIGGTTYRRIPYLTLRREGDAPYPLGPSVP